MSKKNYSLGTGKYYFSINSGIQKILIHRTKKQDAVNWYRSYKRVGKTCEWLGCWNGKEFIETSPPSLND